MVKFELLLPDLKAVSTGFEGCFELICKLIQSDLKAFVSLLKAVMVAYEVVTVGFEGFYGLIRSCYGWIGRLLRSCLKAFTA